jgi:homoserine O-succinyltransferase
MPEKQQTELDISRMLAGYNKDIELILVKISGQKYKTTPLEYMQAHYVDFETIASQKFDGLIVTGAPVEQIPFEEVRYWKHLCNIMDWADQHVKSTLYICWGAQAALYHFYNINKYPLNNKMFGIFNHHLYTPLSSPLNAFNKIGNKETEFPMPVTRHTEILKDEIISHHSLQIIAESDMSGVGIVAEEKGHRIYITGHLEYATQRLDIEYRRDIQKGLPIHEPYNYYSTLEEDKYHIENTWNKAATAFYHSWLQFVD